MFFYIFSFVLICALFYVEELKTIDNRTLSLNLKLTISTILLIFLCLMSSFRWYTGQDFPEYIDIYNFTPSIFSGQNIFIGYGNIEPGFRVVASIAKVFDSHIVYLGLCATLSLIPVALALKNISVYLPINFSYAVLIYFSFFYINYNFNAMRQAITMGFFIYSITYMYERKTAKVFVISLFATTIHSTGLLILLSYIASRFVVVNSYKKLCFIIFMSVVAYKLDIFTKVLSFLGVDVIYWQEKWGAITFSSILLRLLLIGLLSFPKPIFKHGKLGALLFTLYLYGFFIYMSLGSIDMMASRFNMFFRVLEILMIPMLFSLYRYKTNKYLVFAMVISLLVLVLSTTVLSAEVNLFKLFF